MTIETHKTLGRIAYEKYQRWGKSEPAWNTLSDSTQARWEMIAAEVSDETMKRYYETVDTNFSWGQIAYKAWCQDKSGAIPWEQISDYAREIWRRVGIMVADAVQEKAEKDDKTSEQVLKETREICQQYASRPSLTPENPKENHLALGRVVYEVWRKNTDPDKKRTVDWKHLPTSSKQSWQEIGLAAVNFVRDSETKESWEKWPSSYGIFWVYNPTINATTVARITPAKTIPDKLIDGVTITYLVGPSEGSEHTCQRGTALRFMPIGHPPEKPKEDPWDYEPQDGDWVWVMYPDRSISSHPKKVRRGNVGAYAIDVLQKEGNRFAKAEVSECPPAE